MKNEKKELNKSLKLIVKSSAIVLVGIFLSKVLAYLYRIIIARNFGAEVYGLFSIAVMIAGFFSIFASLGLSNGILRYTSFYRGKNQTSKIQDIFIFSFKVMLISSLISTIILFLFSEIISVKIFHSIDLIIFLKWFSLFIPILAITGIFWSLIRAYEEIGWYSFLSNILQNLAQLIILVILILFGFENKAVIFSYNLGYLIVFVASIWVCKSKLPEVFKRTELNPKIKRETNKELISYSWPMMFLGAVILIFSWTDSFVIGAVKGVAETGIYNAAVPIATLLSLVPLLFINLFLPLITREFSNKKNLPMIKELSQQVGKWILILNLPLLVIMILFPGALINILFGAEFILAEEALKFLGIGIFFYSLFNISENLLSMVGKSKIILFNMILAAILNVILNLILVPNLGIKGAAIATMVSYLFWSFLTLFYAKKYTSIIPLRRKMIRVILAMLPPAIIIYYTRRLIPVNIFNILLQGLFFILLYILLIFLTKSLDKNDLMILKAIKQKLTSKS